MFSSFRNGPKAQARNPFSLSWLWIAGSRGACHRAALRADPLARLGMTEKSNPTLQRGAGGFAMVVGNVSGDQADRGGKHGGVIGVAEHR